MDENKTDHPGGTPPERGEGRDRDGRGRGVHGSIWTGLFLLAIGGVLLLDQMGFPFPDWLFNWHSLLIVIGLFVGLRSGFRGLSWLILILIGTFYLAKDSYPSLPVDRFIWPTVLIGIGLVFILRPRRAHWDDARYHRKWDRWRERHESRHQHRYDYYQKDRPNWSDAKASNTTADFLDSTAIFGGTHKKVVTKTFKGGDVTSIMGGTEIDLTQADINGIVVLDVTQIMGGTKIIVPAHWEIRSEVTAIFAGFEDKRQQPAVINPEKVLVLQGTSIFGGIELRNY